MAAKSAREWVLQHKVQLRAQQLPQPAYAYLEACRCTTNSWASPDEWAGPSSEDPQMAEGPLGATRSHQPSQELADTVFKQELLGSTALIRMNLAGNRGMVLCGAPAVICVLCPCLAVPCGRRCVALLVLGLLRFVL